MTNVKWYKATTVQKGRNLSSPAAVRKRLIEIQGNKKSVYNKALKEGKIQVLWHHQKHTKRYDLQVLEEIDAPEGQQICGECLISYFSIGDDYLCPKCRELTET